MVEAETEVGVWAAAAMAVVAVVAAEMVGMVALEEAMEA